MKALLEESTERMTVCSSDGEWIEAVIELRAGTINFPTVEQFLEAEIKGTPLDDLFDEESYRGVLSEAKEKLQQFRVDSGEVIMPMDAFVIIAEKA